MLGWRYLPEPKATKSRMHLDIETPDIQAEAARLEADPEGNEFCVCDAGQPGASTLGR